MFNHFIKTRPFSVIVIILGLLFVPILYNSTALWQGGSADNAFLAELTNEIAQTGKPYSGIAKAVDQAFAKIYLVPPLASELCALPLDESFSEKFNYFKWHTYFALYIIAPLTYILSAEKLLPLLNAFSHLALLLCVVFFFAKRKAPPMLCLLAVLLTALHPAWSDGLQGQVYVDRFVYPLSFLFLYSLIQERQNLWLTIFLATLITSLSDRFGITVLLISLGYIGSDFLTHRNLKTTQSKWPLLLIGITCALVSVLIIKMFIDHPSYNNFGAQFSLANIKNNWTISTFRQNTWKFVLLNFVCLSPFLLFSRYSLIAIGLMLINLIINIGGAEKIGYTTHYHANYFPILIFACCDGLIHAYKIWTAKKTIAAIFVFSSMLLILPHSTTATPKFIWEKSNVPLFSLYDRAMSGKDRSNGKQLDLLRKEIPQGSMVSLPEHLMPTFVSHALIQYYPLGMTNAQYVIVPLTSFEPFAKEQDPLDTTIPGMLIMYKGREEELKANRCLSAKLVSLGYKEHFKNNSWMILKRGGG